MTVDFPGPTVPSDGGLLLLKQTETKFNFRPPDPGEVSLTRVYRPA